MSAAPEPKYTFKLYVAGDSAKSQRAQGNLERIVATYFAGQAEVVIIDLLEYPELGREDQILAIPTLVRAKPMPKHHIIGDLTDLSAVLVGLGHVAEP